MLTEQELNQLTHSIIEIAIEVHRELGPGLLEKVYQTCLRIALEDAGYQVQSEISFAHVMECLKHRSFRDCL